MTSREQFEEVAANKLNFSVSTVIASRNGESYDSKILDTWWYFWKASREAVEVELPGATDAADWLVSVDVMESEHVISAILAAGIKVK